MGFNILDDAIYESSHKVTKPYFKNAKNKFVRGIFEGNTYLDVWMYFPQQIEWLIINHGLIIDLKEFRNIKTKPIYIYSDLGKEITRKSNKLTIKEIITQDDIKKILKTIPLKKYFLSEKALEKLKESKALVLFNREKEIIRVEWKYNQEQLLPCIQGTPQFTKEFKKQLWEIIITGGRKTERGKIEILLKLLGITLIDIDFMISSFGKNSFNKYSESFYTFLGSCIHYGCGEFLDYSETQRPELKALSLATNWFDFNSKIETRIDILLSVECEIRKSKKLFESSQTR